MSDYIQIEGELFEAVQMAHIFTDNKSFVDHRPKSDPATILAQYQAQKAHPDFDLATFVATHFTLGVTNMRDHIRAMWPQLYRAADTPQPNSTLIPLPHPYVVPGGRFREIYYWDSYFTAHGLIADGHVAWVESLVANFAHLIDTYGHIPNGNRRYYLSRSQPPFFCGFVQLLERQFGPAAIKPYLTSLRAEYRYWMDGAAQLATKTAHQHAVRLADGALVNRYWDAQQTPRPEAYSVDRETVGVADAEHPTYRHLRAAAESGWDFSSRWMAQHDRRLVTTHTCDIVPIDLNCLMYNMEIQLGEGADGAARRQTLHTHCWNATDGWFFDYNWRTQQQTGVWSLAGVYPLYFGVATAEQAARIADNVQARFLRDGGVVTTLYETGAQWDAPNGWAPLQWLTVQGLVNYGFEALGREIATRFVTLADNVYRNTGKMMEKYDVCDLTKPAGGGEYPNQDGFGWTNGVVAAFCDQFELLRG